MAEHYPIFVDLRGRSVVVVGGGAAAERRVRALLAAGAAITIIAPELTADLRRLVAAEALIWEPRPFRPGDLAGARLVVAERLDPATNRAIYQEAEERGIFVNVEDDLPNCSFLAPAVLRQGDLTLAISTAGRAPALAVRIRERLERRFGPEYGAFLELAGRFRRPLLAAVETFEDRRRRWYRLVDSPVLELLRQGRHEQALVLAGDILGVDPDPATSRPARDRNRGPVLSFTPRPSRPTRTTS